MADWLEALAAEDLGIVIAGKHYAATQTMDEQQTQDVTFTGAFGSDAPIIRSVRRADVGTVSTSALVLKPGQNAGMDDETFLYGLDSFSIACRRGSSGQPSDWHTYTGCAWTSVRVSSTMTGVTLTVDFSVPGYRPPKV